MIAPAPFAWTRVRRGVQAAVALGFLALPFWARPWLAGTMVALRLGPVDLVEPASAASAALAGHALPLALALGALPVLALAIALGPLYCSWACPWGLLSEGIDRLRGRGPEPAPRERARLRRARIAALAALLGGSALVGAPLAAIVAPPRLVTALPLEAWCARVVPWVTLARVAALRALELLGPRRLVCRALCPAGAAAALLRRRFTWGPRFSPDACRCTDRAPCVRACAWRLDPRSTSVVEGCTSCMACVERCPSAALVALRRR